MTSPSMRQDLHGEHPDYPRESWRDEVAAENTQSGYWEWVIHQAVCDEGLLIENRDLESGNPDGTPWPEDHVSWRDIVPLEMIRRFAGEPLSFGDHLKEAFDHLCEAQEMYPEGKDVFTISGHVERAKHDCRAAAELAGVLPDRINEDKEPGEEGA